MISITINYINIHLYGVIIIYRRDAENEDMEITNARVTQDKTARAIFLRIPYTIYKRHLSVYVLPEKMIILELS
jgi:hypothetical protein